MRLPADPGGQAQGPLRGPRVLKPPDVIFLHGVRFQGHHGVGADERAVGGAFEADVELACDIRRAAASDRVEDTVDYALVHQAILAIGRGPSCSLLETLAERMATAILDRFPAAAVRVRVKKLAPPGMPDVHCAGVEIERTRGHHGGTQGLARRSRNRSRAIKPE